MTVISLESSKWTWYSGGKSGVSAVVGNDWNGAENKPLRRVGRFQFSAPEVGAAGVDIVFHTNKVANSGKFIPLNFYIGTDPDSHANAGPEYEVTGNFVLASDYLTYNGSADIMLHPNQTYYLWIFPGNDEFGWCYGTRLNHTSTLTTIGIAHTLPVVRITDVYRCDAEGNEDKQGSQAMVVFDATIDNEDGDNTASYILLYRVRGKDTWEEIQLDMLTGKFALYGASHIFPADVEKAYEVAVAAVDSVIRVESQYRIIPKAFFFFYADWDLQAWGFGCATSTANSITMGMKMLLNKGIQLTAVTVVSFDEINEALNEAMENIEQLSMDFLLFHVGGTYWHCILCKTDSEHATAEFYSYAGRRRMVLDDGTWQTAETI